MSDRFVAPRPSFKAPTNVSALEAMTPRPKDTTPAPSVIARVQAAGNFDLAALIAASHTLAKQHAKVIERKPRQVSISKGETISPTIKEAPPKFQPDDVVGDEEFIKRTRSLDIHSPQAQALFWANGGRIVVGLTYAQSYDNLRREVSQRLRNAKLGTTPTIAPYHRNATIPVGVRVMTPGMPSQEDRIRQREVQQHTTRTSVNERWAGIKR